jgi:glutamate 5-kinase
VNENDTVATDEIRFGDNDRLAAQVTGLCGADVLVLLSDVDGLYTANPRDDAAARHIPLVREITSEIENMAGGTGTEGAKGGMKTKLMAAQTALQAGAAMAITLGDVDQPLSALIDGARATWFNGDGDPATARKLWIAAMRSKGILTVDVGAAAALRRGRSLLPAGVRGVEGVFRRGDAVEIKTPKGDLVAKALAGYDAGELSAIAGCQSAEIEGILGHPGRAHVVHRDDMVI